MTYKMLCLTFIFLVYKPGQKLRRAITATFKKVATNR